MTTVTVTTTGAGSFTIPAGVTTINVEAWGGGGTGGAGTLGTANQCGGGGGGYISADIPVTGGDIIYWNVAATIANGDGGDTWFQKNVNSSTNAWIAGGGQAGQGAVSSTGGAGGTNTNGTVGTLENSYTGGAGGNAQGGGGSRSGAGGGGAASSGGNGNAGSAPAGKNDGGAGGNAGTGGGAGGAGGSGAGAGTAGTANVEGGGGGGGAGSSGGAGGDGAAPGGGGGAPDNSTTLAIDRGFGARGQIRYTYTEPAGQLAQDSFRFRNDDGSESTATWKAAINTNTAIDIVSNFRVRFLIRETGGAAVTDGYKLQYNHQGGGWNDVTTSSLVQIGPSANLTDGAATTEQMGGAGTFVAGEVIDATDSVTGAIALNGNEDTEIEWSLGIFTTSVRDQDTIQLRVVRDDGTLLNTYTNTPTLTVNDIAYTQDSFRFRNDDGSESAATWQAANNVSVDQPADTNFRVRFLVKYTGAYAPGGTLFASLVYRKNAGSWTSLSTVSSNVRIVDSTNITDGEATTEQMGGAGTFIAGQVKDNLGSPSVSDFGSGEDTEFEWVLQLRSADMTAGDTIELRVQDSNQVDWTYTNTPSITIVGAQDLDPTLYTNNQTFFGPTVAPGAVTLTPGLFTNNQTFYGPTVTTTYDLTAPLYDDGTDTFFAATVAPGAVTLAPNLYDDGTDTFFGPTVAPGAVTLTPGLFTDGDTFYAATIDQVTTLAPSLYTNNQTFFAPTVTATYELTPALYTDADQFFNPTVTTTYELTPALFTDGDNFFAPTVDTTYDLTPSLFTDGDQFFAATVAPGAVTLTPTLYDDGDTFFAATVTQGGGTQTLTPTLYTNNQSFFAPTVAAGAVTLEPGLYTNTQSFFAPTVVPGAVTLTPSLYDDGDTFYAATVTLQGGPQTLIPSLYTDDDTFFAATVTAGAVTLTPPLYTDPDNFFGPTVDATYDLTPGLFTNNQTFPAATVTAGAVTLTPSLYTDGDTFFAATVSQSGAAQDLTVPLYTNTNSFFGPTVDTVYNLLPADYTDPDQFFGPTITVGATTLTPSLFTNEQAFFAHTIGTPGVQFVSLDNFLWNRQKFFDHRMQPGLGPSRRRWATGKVDKPFIPQKISRID